jgi:hypothetical protein
MTESGFPIDLEDKKWERLSAADPTLWTELVGEIERLQALVEEWVPSEDYFL